MKWEPESSAASNANRTLPLLAREFFKAGRAAVKSGRTPDELHQFRIQTKRFRYALEMFAPLYGPRLEERTAILQQLQRTLGKISDAYTIRELLTDNGAQRKRLHSEGKQRIAEFRNYWRNVFDAPGEKKKWITALKRAGVPADEETEEQTNDKTLDGGGAGYVGPDGARGGGSNGDVGSNHHAPQRG